MNGMPCWLLAEQASPLQQIADTFGVSWSQLIAQAISFSIVCLCLERFAYRPVLRMLKERREKIAEGVRAADRQREELEKVELQRKQILADAQRQAETLIADARLAADALRQEKIEQTALDAEQLRAKAAAQIDRDRARMEEELKSQVGRLVIHTAASVTGHVLTDEDQQRLLNETAQSLES